MGLFKSKKEKEIKKVLEETKEELAVLVQDTLEKKEVNWKEPKERHRYIVENCEQIVETTRQMEEFVKEYEAVTAYLTDIQRIDGIPEENKGELLDAARNVLMLTRERHKYQTYENGLTKEQYRILEMNEEQIPDEVKKINEKEAYQISVNRDLKFLEAEKQSIRLDLEQVEEKQQSLTKVGGVLLLVSAAIFLVLIGFRDKWTFDPMVPFLLTIILTSVALWILVKETFGNQYERKVLEKKRGKAIGLLNRVKIKYVNNQLSLDYSYNKYQIKSSSELTKLWEKYVQAKDMESRYKVNTQSLNFYCEQLIKELRKVQVRDPEVWIHQCVALLDNKEMTEIRHRLNVRRQKLRERIDYNTRMKEEGKKNLDEVVEQNPSCLIEVKTVLKEYKLNL